MFKEDTLDAIIQERTKRESEDHNLQVSLNELREKGTPFKTGIDDTTRRVGSRRSAWLLMRKSLPASVPKMPALPVRTGNRSQALIPQPILEETHPKLSAIPPDEG